MGYCKGGGGDQNRSTDTRAACRSHLDHLVWRICRIMRQMPSLLQRSRSDPSRSLAATQPNVLEAVQSGIQTYVACSRQASPSAMREVRPLFPAQLLRLPCLPLSSPAAIPSTPSSVRLRNASRCPGPGAHGVCSLASRLRGGAGRKSARYPQRYTHATDRGAPS